MATAHFYLFSDACPTDWLQSGGDENWHTIVNFVFQLDPALYPLLEQGFSHEEILEKDEQYTRYIAEIQSGFPAQKLKKWSTRGKRKYRDQFCAAFSKTQREFLPIVSACSFKEKTLRASKIALLNSYNYHVGGIAGRGIGFQEFTDAKGRLQLKHSFVDFNGHHEIQASENKMLVLLFMAWFVADQYAFYHRDIVTTGRYGFDNLHFTVVSDMLSGDNALQQMSEQNLRYLIDPEHARAPLVLTRSAASDTFSGDLLVDNLAGWLNCAVSHPESSCAKHAQQLTSTGVWKGWHKLLASDATLKSEPVLS